MENSPQKLSDHSGRSYKEQSVYPIWDCGSLLYDSFELNSLKRQLDSAIASSHRTMSMPHLPNGRGSLDTKSHPQTQPANKSKKSSFRFPRSLQRFLRSVFKPNKTDASFVKTQSQMDRKANIKDGFYVVNNKASMLWTIPEFPELDAGIGKSPEFSSLVRRSASERFHDGCTPRA